MRNPILVVSLVLLLCFAFGCRRGEKVEEEVAANVGADKEEIKKLSDEYGSKVTAGDVDGFLNLFTDDAILMPPNSKMIIGKEEMRPWVQAVFKSVGEMDVEEITTPKEIKVFGNWAFDLGITTFKSRGKPIENTNKYIRIWQKLANGSWKLARVIFNSSNPLPPKEE